MDFTIPLLAERQFCQMKTKNKTRKKRLAGLLALPKLSKKIKLLLSSYILGKTYKKLYMPQRP